MKRPEEQKPIAVYGAIAANVLIAVLKFVVAALIGSSAMLAEAFHSAADTGNELLLLLGIHQSKKPADESHPFGYGQEIYFWGLIVAVVLFGVGGGLSIYEGITRFSEPYRSGNPLWDYLVLGAAFIMEGISWAIAARELNKKRRPGQSFWAALGASKDPDIFIVIGENTADLAGLVAAFFGIFLSEVLHSHSPDAIASIAIGVILCIVAVYLVIESKSLLIGESASKRMLKDIHERVQRHSLVAQVEPPLSVQLNPYEVFLALVIRFQPDLKSGQVIDAMDELKSEIRQAHPVVGPIFFDLEAADQHNLASRTKDSRG